MKQDRDEEAALKSDGIGGSIRDVMTLITERREVQEVEVSIDEKLDASRMECKVPVGVGGLV